MKYNIYLEMKNKFLLELIKNKNEEIIRLKSEILKNKHK